MADVLDRIRSSLAERGYRLDQEIGRGGMALVYRARDVRHERDVAVKVLRPELAAAVGSERFLQEIRVEANLQHPHILPLHDSGEVEGLPYYVMPYVEGESLRDKLQREGQLPLTESLRIAGQIASALSYAHAQGIIHRDIKPENVLLSSGQVLVADFGIARATSEAGGEKLTATGVSVGTPQYMSPEQAAGDEPLDGRSDIYSLGCVLFEMLAGEPPFTGRTAQAVIARHMQERVPSLEVVRPGVPLAAVKVVEKCLAKVPADRFATAEDFAQALEDPAVQGLEEEKGRRIRPGWAALAAAAVLVLAWLGVRILGLENGELDPNKVVVFPLVVSGFGESSGDVGYEVAVTLEAALDHADPLKWIDGWERLDVVQRASPELVSARDKRNITRDRGAQYYLSGVVQAIGDSTMVMLRLDDVAGDSLVGQESITAARSGMALHRISIDAVKRLLPPLVDPDREIDLTPLRDRDAAAIALWVQGERQYRRSQFTTALDFYQRSLDQDSALVFAAIKGAQAASWQILPSAERLAAHAVRHDTLLPARYVDFARGLHAYLTGRADTAVAALEAALTTDPEWAEAHMALGEVYYHLLPTRALLDSLAEAEFRASARADSGFAPPLVHLSEIAIRKGELSQAQLLLDRYRRFRPDPERVETIETMLQCVRDGPEQVAWLSLAQEDPLLVLWVAKNLSVGGLQLECTEKAFASILATNVDAPQEKWGALFGLHGLLVAQDRGSDALALADSAVAAGFGVARALYVIGDLVSPGFGSKAAETDSFIVELAGPAYEGGQPYTRWLHGSWHAHRGNASRVRTVRDALRADAERTGDRELQLYTSSLTAQLSLLEGDTASALRQLRSLVSSGLRIDLEWTWSESLPVERLLLAELLLARGDFEAAHQIATVFDQEAPIVFQYFLPASLAIRYQAARAMDRNDLATRYRERLLDLNRADLVETQNIQATGGGP